MAKIAKNVRIKSPKPAQSEKERKAIDKELILELDNNWKGLIIAEFSQFTRQFLPTLHPLIDHSVPPVFLEQELRPFFRRLRGGKRFTDKLVKVRLKDGTDKVVLIHVEVQHDPEDIFSERMFVYFALIFYRLRLDIVAIAIFTSEKVPPSRGIFSREFHGTKVEYQYQTAWIMDKPEQEWQEAETIFGLAMIAMQYLVNAKDDQEKRLLFKKKLFELAIEKKFSEETINNCLIFVDGILVLSQQFREEFDHYLNTDFAMKTDKVLENKKPPRWGDNLFNSLFQSRLGKPVDEIDEDLKQMDSLKMQLSLVEQQKTLVEQQKTEIEQRNALVEQQKTEIEQRNALVEQQKTEIEQQKTEIEQRNALVEQQKTEIEHTLIQGILKMHFELQWDIDKIADLLGLDKAAIQKIIDANKPPILPKNSQG